MSNLEFLRNYIEIASKIKKIAREYDDSARVIVFGSVIRGTYNAASDLDVLIISEKRELWKIIRGKIFLEFLNEPVEVHFATESEYVNWYMKFIDVSEEI